MERIFISKEEMTKAKTLAFFGRRITDMTKDELIQVCFIMWEAEEAHGKAMESHFNKTLLEFDEAITRKREL